MAGVETVESVPSITPDGRYRSIWPLPGGRHGYVTSLRTLLPFAAGLPQLSEFITQLHFEFPEVESLATATEMIRSLVALGFVEGRANNERTPAR